MLTSRAMWFGFFLAGSVCGRAALATVCVVPDDGSDTAQLPPTCPSGYGSTPGVHVLDYPFPPGTMIYVQARHAQFELIDSSLGGTLGGEVEHFGSHMLLVMQGTGLVAGFMHIVDVPLVCETHIGPRTRGEATQSFDTAMISMQGQITDDPEFTLLRILGGSALGLDSPGRTTLTRRPSGDWAVDSFFEISYVIEITFAPGSTLGQWGGAVGYGEIRMETARDQACCFESQCVEILPDDCCALGGLPQGSGTDCIFPGYACFNPTGVRPCCLPNDECIDTLVPDCCAQGGLPRAFGSACDPSQPCEPRALIPPCCLPDGGCTMLWPSACGAAGGVIASESLHYCWQVYCPPPEGCCLPDGGCTDTAYFACAANGGISQGPGTSCAIADCSACCLPDDQGCVSSGADVCRDILGGVSLGSGTSCLNDGQDCYVGACCQRHGDRTCIGDLPPDVCHSFFDGMFLGSGTTCAEVGERCLRGACCQPDGSCVDTLPPGCSPFLCAAALYCPGTPLHCFADADCNGVVNPADRGVISANIGGTLPDLICQFDLDGNGVINPGDRGIVSANIGACVALPDWQEGFGCNHGVCPDPRFEPQRVWQGFATSCSTITCP